MSIIDPEPQTNGTDEELEGEGRDLRNLRAKAKTADKLSQENETLRNDARELAFFKAGLTSEDLESELGKLFMAGYTNELEATAIQASWAAVSGNRVAAPVSESSTTERQALASDSVSDTGVAPAVPVRGPEGAAVKAGQAVLASGGTREDAMGTVFSKLVDGAVAGDQTVVLPAGGGVREQ